MCGIAGLILSPGAATPDPAVLARLIGSLHHRGPDGSGQTVVGHVALLHNRLSIIDLVTGDQPLHAGTAALVANGEVYNYRELRAAMPDTRFASNSDCEPPLHLWLRDGSAYAEQLRGMYAIAIHERRHHTVTLTRDPFGIKPLYIAEVAGGLAFTSEPQSLLEAGLVRRAVRPGKVEELLQLQFTTGADTVFDGIQRLLPGETLTCTDGAVADRQRLSPIPPGPPESLSEDEALRRLDTALLESVDLHQRSDVPYGMFLSGGIDSSVLITLMARLNEQPVLAFTAGFDAPGSVDEREHAAAVAKAVGARHEAIEVTEAMVWERLPEIVAAMDDPAMDYAIIPTWFLARRARQDVKVVLSGEGGDEIFGGYDRYRRATLPWWRGGQRMWATGSFDKVPVLRSKLTAWRDGMAAAEVRANEGGRTDLAGAQALDIADWLPHDLLLKLDRCLMAHAVEGRTPFLDKGIVEAAFRLPDSMKMRGKMGKWILRRWLEANLPMARPFAPKTGFTVPVGAWIKAKGNRLGPLVAAQPGIAEIAHPDQVEALFRDIRRWRHGFACWKLLFYALWHRRHILGLPPQGDVFETLSAR
ncbi:asparagine synthase (glutamine-hydrolyzing) [Rhodopila sp.]|jgi:asparagine synthase (glutamine-hydrolysing)|uniref:asparagine synthase (glutamine-hydrolyzing) n=1 Tax=Rhodopila sp. TaxID=2480087 RepID=UPI002CFC0D8D|nr:asparagine synthase (glutamine-hydrolyzing) [Rhodopila sp.]HVZ08478.1 asparagine synthase (glutamine-hydrolyzing) [Rhodopila sp.]